MNSASLAGRSILVVEDEPIIAKEITQAFRNVGAAVTATTTLKQALILVEHGAVVMTARSLPDAIRLVERDGLAAAVLDFGLGDGNAGALCGRLKTRRIPFVLHSGYTPEVVGERWRIA
jgi:CheY-like chemotaxis protein